MFKRLKVYFVNSFLEGCYNVRCLLPLMENGWDGDRTSFRQDNKSPENKTRAVLEADIVVFHRPDDPDKLKMAKMLKADGKKIVFDNDDTVKDDGGFKFNEFLNKERFEKGMKTLNETLDEFIKFADLVTCSTKFLEEEYKKLNDNVVMLPNCIDPFLFPEPKEKNNKVVRIGMTGSVGITSDMDVLKPIVEKYHKDPRVKLVLFSMPPSKTDKTTRELYKDEYDFWESVNVEWQPFVVMEEYYEKLNDLQLDFIIIPRADNYFNRCKSNLKFLENSMLEIPSICQAFDTGDSPYQQNPEDSKYLLLANAHEEWVEQIEKLINNKELREEIGKKARDYVEENYSIEKNAYKWSEAYKTIK